MLPFFGKNDILFLWIKEEIFMKKVLVAVLLLMSLVACGAKETTTICTAEDYYGSYKTTYVAKSDEVQVITTVSTFYVDDYYTTDEVYAELENYANAVASVKGVTYGYEYDETTRLLVETTSVDFRKTKISDLVSAGFFDSSYASIDYISLKQSIELQKNDGGVCETK